MTLQVLHFPLTANNEDGLRFFLSLVFIFYFWFLFLFRFQCRVLVEGRFHTNFSCYYRASFSPSPQNLLPISCVLLGPISIPIPILFPISFPFRPSTSIMGFIDRQPYVFNPIFIVSTLLCVRLSLFTKMHQWEFRAGHWEGAFSLEFHGSRSGSSSGSSSSNKATLWPLIIIKRAVSGRIWSGIFNLNFTSSIGASSVECEGPQRKFYRVHLDIFQMHLGGPVPCNPIPINDD